MFDRLIHFSIHNKLIVGLLTAALVVWGGYSLAHLPIDAVPDITTNQVVVYTVAPSLAAADIERLVTFPVEQAVATIPNRAEVRSFSRFGLSVITIVFSDDTDIYWARQQVAERLREAENQIPPGVGRPELAPVSTGLGEIYQYIVRPKKGYEKQYDARELRTIQDWIVRRQLLGTPGVADVSSFGGLLKQYEIALDPERLRAFGVSVEEVRAAVAANNQNAGGAYVDQNPAAYFIRTEGLAHSLDDLGTIVVRRTAAGLPVLVRDVADVRLGAAVRYGAMTRNDEGEVTGGIVLMLKGANANEVIQGVKARMAQIEKTLPKGVAVDVYLDRSELVGRAIGTVKKNLLEGALIVVLVLVLFLGNVRAGLVVASVIPLAMLFAVAMMRLFGVSGNLLSLGAIDFGLVVDGAVIIVEAIVHRLALRGPGNAARLTPDEMNAETYTATARIRQSAAFGEIIILIVYLPLLALVGTEGKMFRPMAQTVAFAILGAFILSLTYVPMMSALALSRQTVHKRNFSDQLMDWLGARYRPLLDAALRHRAGVLGLSGALLVASGLGFRALGGEFIPQLWEGDFAAEMRVLPGSSLAYTIEKAQQVSGLLKRQFPSEVREVVAKVGSAEIPTDPMPIEAADIMVVLEKDQAKWRDAASPEELTAKMAAAAAVIPGVTFSFQQPIQMRFNELSTGAKQDVVVKIYGEDFDQLADYARAVGRLARTVPGAEDVYVEEITGLPQIVVEIDRPRLAQFGLNVEDVNRTVQTAFAGQAAGQVFEQERRYDVVLRLRPELRQNIESVRRLLLSTPSGEAVPLEQVARVELRDGPNQVQRDDARRRITVAFNVRGRDVESVVGELQSKLDRRLKLAPGYALTYGGQFENLRAASARLQIAVPVALGLIFLLLFFTFTSWRQALLIFTAIPLAAVGGVAALWLRGMPFSISAGVGFIALFGVAVLNGIVLIGQFNHLRDEGVTDILERIRRGTADRLRPVLMTATVASLGFLPMALSKSAGAEVQRPLATVVIGGLLTATLLTLLVLPVLYTLTEPVKPHPPHPSGPDAPPATPPHLPTFSSKGEGEPEREHGAHSPPSPLGERPGVRPRALTGPGVSLAALACLLLALPTRAQDVQLLSLGAPLTATSAVAQALAAGGTVTGATRALEAQQAARRAAFDLPRTSINGSYGQYNTFRRDNQISVSQQFALPGVYRRAADVADAQISGRQMQLTQARAELRRQVRLRYQDAVAARHRLRTLRGQDSLYTEFRRAAELRFKAGEVARLEPATALVQQGEVQVAAWQARTELRVALRELQALLQAPDSVMVADSVLTALAPAQPLPTAADTAWLARSPDAGPLRAAVVERRAETRLERARGLPELSVGYFNQSLRGPQELDNGTTRFYSGATRFQGVQAGVSVSLWRRPLRARVQAAGLQEQVAAAAYERARAALTGRLDALRLRRTEALRRVAFYETTGVPQAAVIERLSQLGFRAGETGYAEYLLSLDRARRLRLDYVDALLTLNQVAIELDYLLDN